MYRLLAVAVTTTAVVGCGGESATYSSEEVVDAFQRHGYTLVARELPEESAAAREGDLLAPHDGQPFLVIVASDAAADEAWPDYESQKTRNSFDARRANVVVTSDGGLDTAQRDRVRAALSSLPARGPAVVIAGRE